MTLYRVREDCSFCAHSAQVSCAARVRVAVRPWRVGRRVKTKSVLTLHASRFLRVHGYSIRIRIHMRLPSATSVLRRHDTCAPARRTVRAHVMAHAL